MKTIKTTEGKRVTLSIVGTINTETAAELGNELQKLDYDGLDLTLDFGKTDYITSAGLRALLVARKKLPDSAMRIIHANANVREVFSMTGFDSMIRLEETEDAQTPAENGLKEKKHYRLGFSNLLRERLKTDRYKTAYVFNGRSYSWDEVDKISQLIADDLAKMGVKKGSHVGICAPNGINWVACFYGIQKLGAIAVLINPGLRPTEVVALMQVADTAFLCYAEIPGKTTFAQYQQACMESGAKAVYDIGFFVDYSKRYAEYPAIAEKYSESFPADDASVIIFTSGSTGLPKAILSSSFNCMVGIEPLIKEVRLCGADVSLGFLPFFHIFGFTTGISAAVLTGYVTVIPDSKSPDAMVNLIEQYRCTVFNTVPTMMLAMLQTKDFAPQKLATLRVSVLGGSATTESQMKKLKSLLPNTHFGNIYGMSENAAVSLTGYDDTIEHITQTVGRPVEGLEIEIRDVNSGKALAAGQKGEICIRSKAMVICYYRLAVDKQPVDAEGWLATGDLGILGEDGYLRIVGRKKDLIICGGENISPGEIADAMTKLPQVADVKVLGVPHEIKGEVVAAAVILKDGAVWSDEEARTALSQSLAKYKIPVHFVTMDAFPMLGSGKVDAMELKKQVIAKITQA